MIEHGSRIRSCNKQKVRVVIIWRGRKREVCWSYKQIVVVYLPTYISIHRTTVES